MEQDNRIAYGAMCTWWDSIRRVGSLGRGPLGSLPCCPKCKGVLFEVDDETKWFVGIDAYEKDGHPGYRAMMEWGKGRCYSTLEALSRAYSIARIDMAQSRFPPTEADRLRDLAGKGPHKFFLFRPESDLCWCGKDRHDPIHKENSNDLR